MNDNGIIDTQLTRLRDFYADGGPPVSAPGQGYRQLLARYYGLMFPPDASVLEVGCGAGDLLALLPNRDIAGVDLSAAQVEAARRRLPHGDFRVQAGEQLDLRRTFDVIILSETINFAADVQRLVENLQAVATPQTRLVINFHSSLWRPALALATALGLKSPNPQSNWLSHKDVWNLCALADWEVIKTQWRILFPLPVPGLDTLLNRWLAPLLPALCLTVFVVATFPASRRGDSPAGSEVAESVGRSCRRGTRRGTSKPPCAALPNSARARNSFSSRAIPGTTLGRRSDASPPLFPSAKSRSCGRPAKAKATRCAKRLLRRPAISS